MPFRAQVSRFSERVLRTTSHHNDIECFAPLALLSSVMASGEGGAKHSFNLISSNQVCKFSSFHLHCSPVLCIRRRGGTCTLKPSRHASAEVNRSNRSSNITLQRVSAIFPSFDHFPLRKHGNVPSRNSFKILGKSASHHRRVSRPPGCPFGHKFQDSRKECFAPYATQQIRILPEHGTSKPVCRREAESPFGLTN